MQKKQVLSDHKKIGKRFLPPLLGYRELFQEVGWLDWSLPELLWLAILNERYGLETGADLAVSMAKEVEKVYDREIKKWFAPISIFNLLNHEQKTNILRALKLSNKLEPLKQALSSFISLYPKCPLNFLFENILPHIDNFSVEMEKFKNLLSRLYDKTTIEATHMQANAIYIAFVTDKLKVFKGSSLANLPEIQRYPHTEESKKVAASIRSTINGFIGTDCDKTSEWPRYFWNRGLELEPCDFQSIFEAYE